MNKKKKWNDINFKKLNLKNLKFKKGKNNIFSNKNIVYKLIIAFLSIFTITCVMVAIYVGYVAISTPAFDVAALESADATRIYAADGTLIAKLSSGDNTTGERNSVTYDQLPQVLIDAIVAAEDSRYFEHTGFDIPRIVKAVFSNISKGKLDQGGSTITQQVIKKGYFPAEETKISRKIQEVILALQAEKTLSKEKILELYLNKIYFGSSLSSIGISSGANYYFSKNVEELTLPEAALLAGVLNLPHSYDPYYNLEGAQARRDVILNLMYRHGYISHDELDAAKAIPVANMLTSKNKSTDYYPYQSYIDVVTKEVQKETNLDPRTVPMEIYTYMDINAQTFMDEVNAGKIVTYPNEFIEVGSTLLDSKTGRIIAIAGGRDFAMNSPTIINHATSISAQPGSTLKPLLAYAPAIEYLGWSTAHIVTDRPYFFPVESGKMHSINNWYKSYYGDVTLVQAIGDSINTTALYTYTEVTNAIGGRSAATSYLNRLGFNVAEKDWSIPYSVGMWTYGTTPTEIAGAYTALANEGMCSTPHAVNKVIILDDRREIEIDSTEKYQPTEVFSAQTAYLTNKVMQEVVNTPRYSYSNFIMPNVDIQLKTGTSDWGDEGTAYGIPSGANKDRFLVAYTPDYVMVTWMGYDEKDLKNNKGLYIKDEHKGYVATITEKAFKNVLYKNNTGTHKYSTPDNIVTSPLVKGIYPYVLPDDGIASSNILTGYFLKGTEPKSLISIPPLNTLNDFTATIVDNKIDLVFSEYDPVSATLPSTGKTDFPTYDNKTISLPHINGIYHYTGPVQYGYTITDKVNGTTLSSGLLSSDKGTISIPNSKDIIVCGYYTYSSYLSTKSNEKCVELNNSNVAVDRAIQANVSTPTGTIINNKDTTIETTLLLQINKELEGDTFTAVLNDTTDKSTVALVLDNSNKATINNLISLHSYEIVITMVDALGDTTTKKIAFTVQ